MTAWIPFEDKYPENGREEQTVEEVWACIRRDLFSYRTVEEHALVLKDRDDLIRADARNAPRTVTPEQVEERLIRDWHEDQCACADFDGTDIETCYTRKTARYRGAMCPPTSWGVEEVMAAMGIEVMR